MKVAIRYFTGTGNTARACALIERTFVSAGWTVDRREIRSRMADPYGGAEDAELLVVAFPVLGFAVPGVVRTWIGRLPKRPAGSDGTGTVREAAVLCVSGAAFVRDRYVPGWGAGAPFAAARRLARRGRDVVGIGEVSYPENWTQVSDPPGEADAKRIRARNDPGTRAFAAALAAGERPMLRRSAAGRYSMAAVALLFRLVGARVLGRLFIADSSCSGCALCARSCPAAAVRMRRGRPRWTLRCVACNRCINACPSRSIRTSSLALALHISYAVATTAGALSFPLSDDIAFPLRGLIRAAALAAIAALQVGPFSWLLAVLARSRHLQGAFQASFMSRYRRYLDPGFNPSE